MPYRGRGHRYGSWRGGPDPLKPPFDVRDAVDQIGKDVLAGSDLRSAIDRLLDRGASGRDGLQEMRRRLRERREMLERRGNLGGTLDTVRAALDQALAAETDELASRADDDAARMAEMELAELPPDTASAVRELADYQWASDEARQIFDSIKDLLKREVLDAQFAGMKQALEGGDPEAMQAVRDMLADLNQLLAAHARGQDTTEQFERFMEQHGEFFPEQPQDTDDLIDLLARRQAAADRLMRSLTPEQREELSQLMQDAMGDDVDLQSQLSQLQDNLHGLRPGMMRGRGRVDGQGDPDGEPMGYGDAVGAVADLSDLEQLEAQLSQDYGGASLDDVDVDALERQLTPAAVQDLRALRELERELERQGYLHRDGGELSLTPKALRRLGESALRRVFDDLDSQSRGDHSLHRPGAADDRTGASLPWNFGDERPLDAVGTVRNAVLRTAGSGRPLDGRLRLDPDDFSVEETEHRTVAAVALCVDLSFSMVQEDRWGPMKQTALALSHLISTRFRTDALQIIGFSRMAHRLTDTELASREPSYEQGTNLHHALQLAGRHLRRHPEAEPVVLVVTDGEPTAHLEPDGNPFFSWPTTQETLRATLGEVDAMTRMGATMNFFLLGDDPGLARFVGAVARRNGGRVFAPSLDRLGEYVVSDYLRSRRG
ncbi:vWA domain-containing protein [Solicola sp. PLA-1-18]|uniref:vWA domain-containing protein n=1 Tax=Solicola sp. PLA-1-18 TaxID=3380532 RepID=UPI003B78BD75